MNLFFLVLLILFGASGSIVLVIKNLYYICQPSEILIFAGTRHSIAERQRIGYRLVKGGSSIRKPLLEKVFRMELTNMIIELKVTNAYSKGGIPLKVDGVANIKVAGEEPTIHNAIERLLDKSREEIEKIAQETLEGNLRGVLASLTPEQVNEDKMAFARSLLEEAEEDLERLGLVLDNLQIQNISDEVNYLNSIGRKQRADLMRDARIAEANTKTESALQSTENNKNTSLRKIEAQIEMARAEAERRLQNALTQREAGIAEAESEIAAEVARTQAELAVQRERRKQVEQQLQADVVAPAEAECKRAQADAKGQAASIIEDGKAQAEGIRQLAESWKAAGENAREIFLFQKLEPLLQNLVGTIPDVDVEKVTVVDPGGGSSATKLASFMEQLRQTTGIDLVNTVQSFGQNGGSNWDAQSSQDSAAIADVSSIPTGDTNEDLQREVQQQIEQITESNPYHEAVEAALERAIQNNPRLKRRLRRALQVGGEKTLKAIFSHPLVDIPTSTIRAWIETD
ncbi:SPFH domain-containing protein [Geitlerinema sp. PCC 9228]|jgi:flotillin|uniref:flotillin family protein n=1 Tax=Geitlerinema sp. PCC 9228 TaxID=111611 RepID=UPI0008F9C6BA|nr:SPFH domain-containing protein [Geitlerinema sp. PCC 9228]